MVSSDEVVGTRFASGVRGVRVIAVELSECRILGVEGAVDLVGADLVKEFASEVILPRFESALQ